MLPLEVITADHQLEEIADRASGALAQYRWHWTLDESNPGRVNPTEYARQVERDERTIARMVNGYATWLDENMIGTRPARPLNDHIGKARMSGETAAAAEAVANARGLTIRGVSDPGAKHHNEVRRVRDIARQLAEEHGTSIEEEAPKVAETIVKHEQAERQEQRDRAQRTDLRVIQAEQQVLIAKRAILKAIGELDQVELGNEERELLIDAHNALKAASALFDARLSGKSGVDWDAELARLA